MAGEAGQMLVWLRARYCDAERNIFIIINVVL